MHGQFVQFLLSQSPSDFHPHVGESSASGVGDSSNLLCNPSACLAKVTIVKGQRLGQFHAPGVSGARDMSFLGDVHADYQCVVRNALQLAILRYTHLEGLLTHTFRIMGSAVSTHFMASSCKSSSMS